MEIRPISPHYAASPQLQPADIARAAEAGYKTVVCNRPDDEGEGQPKAAAMAAAARAAGVDFRFLPIKPGSISRDAMAAFNDILATAKGPILGYCRTGNRSATLWALSKAPLLSPDAICAATRAAGFDLAAMRPRLEAAFAGDADRAAVIRHDVVVVGGGAGGLAVIGSLLKRKPGLDVALIEPREEHFYQPGWTLVGAGVFKPAATRRRLMDVVPDEVQLIRGAVAAFRPEDDEVVLEDGQRVAYTALIVAPGLKLDWGAVPGLAETLGKNGVTSNYSYRGAPYTWELVKGLKSGKAIFTQPPMPIKCAGAPQKAMYLSADHWRRSGRLKSIDIEFCNAGGVLFGVPDYVPGLMKYVEKYGIDLSFGENLVAIDGPARKATFEVTKDGRTERVVKDFDMIHVCPPQTGPDFIKASPLADAAGWIEVNPDTLQHARFPKIWGMGDGTSTPNAKTAAAVRKQAPVVAINVLNQLKGRAAVAAYDGYGSCPLTVEKGRIILAEFGYGGKLMPSFPEWMIDGKQPTRAAWLLKERLLPPMYWQGMFKGREWLAQPNVTFKPVGAP
ncbi:MAG TPA: TIGR01244 family phosphatase [Rhodobacteraceae bacterium]|jgi:sulfide:quinone oxidoreductase|nr:TIGR01244 family phosphatase [Paracoccaceae bacterium]HBG98654.1 TIGR01244 family phosphatase [Paracoccaceae bacterium]